MSPDDPRHGTPAGYAAHRKLRETACDPCLAANAEKARNHRKVPAHRQRSRDSRNAASRALWALSRTHREEYEKLYADFLTEIRNTKEKP